MRKFSNSKLILQGWLLTCEQEKTKQQSVGYYLTKALLNLCESYDKGYWFSLGHGVYTCGGSALYIQYCLNILRNNTLVKRLSLVAQNQLVLLEHRQYGYRDLLLMVDTVVSILRAVPGLFDVKSEYTIRDFNIQAISRWDNVQTAINK